MFEGVILVWKIIAPFFMKKEWSTSLTFVANQIIWIVVIHENLNGTRYLEMGNNQIFAGNRAVVSSEHLYGDQNSFWLQHDEWTTHNTHKIA